MSDQQSCFIFRRSWFLILGPEFLWLSSVLPTNDGIVFWNRPHLTDQLYHMQQNSSSEANSHSNGQGIPCHLCIAKVHNQVHNSPPVDPILSLIKPFCTIPLSFFKILQLLWPKFYMHISSLPFVLHYLSALSP